MADHKQTSVAKREPAVLIGTISALVAAVLALITAFGVDVSEDQQTAILGVIAAATPIVAAILTRRKVSPADQAGRHEAP